MGETKYFLMEVDKLIPYARNARTHSEVQIAQIAASIQEFGFLSPVIIQRITPSCVDMEDIMLLRNWGLKDYQSYQEEVI